MTFVFRRTKNLRMHRLATGADLTDQFKTSCISTWDNSGLLVGCGLRWLNLQAHMASANFTKLILESARPLKVMSIALVIFTVEQNEIPITESMNRVLQASNNARSPPAVNNRPSAPSSSTFVRARLSTNAPAYVLRMHSFKSFFPVTLDSAWACSLNIRRSNAITSRR